MSRRWRGEGAPPRPLIVTTTEATRIAEGRKTQLLRLARADSTTHRPKPCGMRPGSVYDVQVSTDRDPATRIVVISVEDQRLVDITFAQARAEGHRTRADFASDWMSRHDLHWPLLEEILCPKCEGTATVDGDRCDGGCDDVGTIIREAELDEHTTLDIFQRRHVSRHVWVVTFEIAQHLYLHRKTDGGYTADPREALLDAGAVLDPPRPDWARRAELHRREALRAEHGARLAGRGPAERLEELSKLAREMNVDIDSDLKVIRHRMNAMERKLQDRVEEREAA